MSPGESSELISRPSALGEGNTAAESRGTSALRRRHAPGPHLSLGLIDPKPLTRQAILEMLAKALPEYAIAAVSSCEGLLETGSKPRSWVLIILYTRSARSTDLWVQHAREFVSRHLADPPVALLSDRDDAQNVLEALTSGVHGFIPTSLEAEVAARAVRLITAGGTFIPAHTLRAAITKTDTGPNYERRSVPVEWGLTPRELSVIDLLREGKPNKVIAIKLNMQDSTVKVHVRNILRKLHAANRTHAACLANRLLGQQAEG